MPKHIDRKHLPTLIAMSVPVVFILALVFVLYVPSLLVRPQYDFIYADTYYHDYTVENGKIVQQTTDRWFPGSYSNPEASAQLHRYNVKDRKSQTISLADAQKLKIAPGETSPDGFEWSDSSSSGSGFWPLFWSGGSSTPSLKGNGATFRLDGLDISYYRVKIIGWVIGE